MVLVYVMLGRLCMNSQILNFFAAGKLPDLVSKQISSMLSGEGLYFFLPMEEMVFPSSLTRL